MQFLGAGYGIEWWQFVLERAVKNQFHVAVLPWAGLWYLALSVISSRSEATVPGVCSSGIRSLLGQECAIWQARGAC